MYKKTVEYVDFNGVKRVEDLYFNFSTTQFTLFMSKYHAVDDPEKFVQRMLKENNTSKMILFFSDFIANAYGKKSEDGQRFVKSRQISEDFKNSAAFEALFSEFLQNPKLAQELANGSVSGISAQQNLTPDQQAQVDKIKSIATAKGR